MNQKDFNISLLLDFYGEMLTEKQREMLDYYYNSDYSLAEISEHAGITRQGVRDAIKRAEKDLKDMEHRLGMLTRFHAIQSALREIHQAAARIARENEQKYFSTIIKQQSEKIISVLQNLDDL